MWARVVEIMLGFWLLASQFIFMPADTAGERWAGIAVVVFGFLSFWSRAGWAHFLTLMVALSLIVYGYAAGHPAPPSAQNQIIVGILLGMFAIIPNNTNDLPASWQRYYSKNHDQSIN